MVRCPSINAGLGVGYRKVVGTLKPYLMQKNLFDLFALIHPAETSKNSDICDFLKVSDIGKSIVLNGETYILNDTSQFCEHILENIYIEKNCYNRNI